jgi:APA family basic amino acid/polyamine antiporter
MFLVKPKKVVVAEQQQELLERTLSLYDLLAIGIGGTVGSGVFVLTGLIAHEYAGPGVWLLLCVRVCACVRVCVFWAYNRH